MSAKYGWANKERSCWSTAYPQRPVDVDWFAIVQLDALRRGDWFFLDVFSKEQYTFDSGPHRVLTRRGEPDNFDVIILRNLRGKACVVQMWMGSAVYVPVPPVSFAEWEASGVR
jgi:hypothetical protein